MTLTRAVVGALVGAQLVALVVLLSRLLRARRRVPPVAPMPRGLTDTRVSVVIPTYNEAARIAPCLEGLRAQGHPLWEVIVVDSRSTDGTAACVQAAAERDPRLRLTEDPPLPNGWVGKVWALQHGLSLAEGEWVLGMDADTRAVPGLVAAVVAAARKHDYDVVSFAPRFGRMTAAEQWVQVSMLVTLVYRGTAAGQEPAPVDRVLANGQCFLGKRDVLLAHGGYAAACASWADDVTLARHLARSGVRVGFLDGARLYRVDAYRGLRDMWKGWGRSFDLADATTRLRQWGDVTLVTLTQGIPLPFLALVVSGIAVAELGLLRAAALAVNALLLGARTAMLFALQGSYERRSVGFWLSPLSDPLAAWRLVLSTVKRPTSWRGRHVGELSRLE